MKPFNSLLPTLVVVALFVLMSPSASKCDWQLMIEGNPVSLKKAPKEKQRYIMAGKSSKGLNKVSKAMKEGPESGNFLVIRSLKELVMTDILATGSALKWLCGQNNLEKYIDWIELDQPVYIGGDAKRDYELPSFRRTQEQEEEAAK